MDKIEIIPLIKREMKKRWITPAELARAFDMNSTSVRGMLSRTTLQVQKLADLSEYFQYNFFRELAEKFPYDEPHVPAEKNEVEQLRNRIWELELETNVLRQTIKDLAQK